jgi:hypothetical protein
MHSSDPIKRVLARHGVENALDYLADEGKYPEIASCNVPDIKMRGNIYMMLDRMVKTADLFKRFAKLDRL